MKQYPEKFHEGYEIGSVYGTFPGAIWNGGRAVFGISSKAVIKSVLDNYNSLGVPVRFTWTNSLIEEKHLNDTYCNLIMEMANNGKNQVLVNREVLGDYLRKTFKKVRIYQNKLCWIKYHKLFSAFSIKTNFLFLILPCSYDFP